MTATTPTRDEHVAAAALDESGCAYLIFDPVDPAADRQSQAINLGVDRTFDNAEQLALEFNEGRACALKVNPRQMLVGDQIPPLHRGLE